MGGVWELPRVGRLASCGSPASYVMLRLVGEKKLLSTHFILVTINFELALEYFYVKYSLDKVSGKQNLYGGIF